MEPLLFFVGLWVVYWTLTSIVEDARRQQERNEYWRSYTFAPRTDNRSPHERAEALRRAMERDERWRS